MITVRGVVGAVHYADSTTARTTWCGDSMLIMSPTRQPVATCRRCTTEAGLRASRGEIV